MNKPYKTLRKTTVLLILVLGSVTVMGQNLEITFSGTGESTLVDSVTATNTATDQTVTLPGNETLILELTSRIESLKDPTFKARFYPNPFENTSTLRINQSKPEDVLITVRNLVGQLVFQAYQYLDPGQHSFAVSFDTPGIFIVSIAGETEKISIKAVCTNANSGSVEVAYSGSLSFSPGFVNSNEQKSQQAVYSLEFTLGDPLSFTCTSGKYSTTITNSPTVTCNYEVEFVECTDPDGRIYKVVQIGEQMWMAENLAYLPLDTPRYSTRFRPGCYIYGYHGSKINEAKSTDYYNTYGVLYAWSTALVVCPSGWHLSSDEEWKTLEKTLGMSVPDADSTSTRYSGSVGAKLKSSNGWLENGNGNNSSGFDMFPGGGRIYSGSEVGLGTIAVFWTASTYANFPWQRSLRSNDSGVYRDINHTGCGFSVRCIKDE